MLPETDTINMITLLRDKTRDNQLTWTLTSLYHYSLSFGDFSFVLTLTKDPQGRDLLTFSITSAGLVAGTQQYKTDDTHFELVRDLYDRVAVRTILHLYEKAKDSLEKPRQAPPRPPTPPNAEQIEKIFNTIKGDWHLNYSRGTEEVAIDPAGNYFVKPATSLPTFRLTVIACSPDLKTVEWGKDKPNGDAAKSRC